MVEKIKASATIPIEIEETEDEIIFIFPNLEDQDLRIEVVE